MAKLQLKRSSPTDTFRVFNLKCEIHVSPTKGWLPRPSDDVCNEEQMFEVPPGQYWIMDTGGLIIALRKIRLSEDGMIWDETLAIIRKGALSLEHEQVGKVALGTPRHVFEAFMVEIGAWKA